MRKLTLAVAFAAVAVAMPATSGAAPFLYVTNQRSANVSSYEIGNTGLLSPTVPALAPAGPSAEGVAVSPDGLSVYVVSIGANSVFQFNVDPVSGALSPKAPATVPAGQGPVGITVTPDGRSAYVANGVDNDNSISQYDIDPVSGVLTAKVPATVPAGRGPYEVRVSPNGRSAVCLEPSR